MSCSGCLHGPVEERVIGMIVQMNEVLWRHGEFLGGECGSFPMPRSKTIAAGPTGVHSPGRKWPEEVIIGGSGGAPDTARPQGALPSSTVTVDSWVFPALSTSSTVRSWEPGGRSSGNSTSKRERGRSGSAWMVCDPHLTCISVASMPEPSSR